MTMSSKLRSDPNTGRVKPAAPGLGAYTSNEQVVQCRVVSQHGVRRSVAEKVGTGDDPSRNSGLSDKIR
jgi:hypothetical protein